MNPLMQGLKTFVDTQTAAQAQHTIDKEKLRTELTSQFENDIKSATTVLSKAQTPQQRAAIGKLLEQMRSVYTGAAAKEVGLDGYFNRNIDFALQTPQEAQPNKGSTTGSTSFERTLSLLPEEDRIKLARQKAETDARGGMSPFDRKLDVEQAVEFQTTQQEGINTAAEMAALNSLEQSVDNVGPDYQGFGADYIPAIGADAQALDKAAVEGALKAVNLTKGAVSDREMELFAKTSVGRGKKMELNKSIIQAAKAVTVRKSQRAQFYSQYLDSVGSIRGAASAFKRFADENPIFTYDGVKVNFLKSLDEVANDKTWQKYIPGGQTINNDPVAIEAALNRMDTSGGMSSPPPAPITKQTAPAVARKVYNVKTGEFE